LLKNFKKMWKGIRRLSGDDAYEQYLKHYALYHAQDATPPLDRAAFFKAWQDEKWKGIKRCC
jgi:uncharacterized short protein YbdD (DUF466 family)